MTKRSIQNRWYRYIRRWKKEHPPNHEGYYICGICGKWVDATEVSLDHIIPRSARPDLIFVDSNIQPTHYICNTKKGSKHEKLTFDGKIEL